FDMFYFFFQAEDGIRDFHVTGVRRVLFRSMFALDFDQRISLSLQGKVGTRLNTDINFDNQATMGFQQQMVKLQYEPDEDAIIQGIEVGNVSMRVNNTLIRGAQNVIGVKSKLQFGRTTV